MTRKMIFLAAALIVFSEEGEATNQMERKRRVWVSLITMMISLEISEDSEEEVTQPSAQAHLEEAWEEFRKVSAKQLKLCKYLKKKTNNNSNTCYILY